jgi:hypothetical protein
MMTMLIAICCAVILALSRPREISRARLIYAWKAIWPAAALGASCLDIRSGSSSRDR